MRPDDERSTVEQLDLTLSLYRRLLLRCLIVLVGGIVIDILLINIGTWLSPPYGVSILGEGLGAWGLIAIVTLLFAEIWIDGRAIGRALNDPVMSSLPVIGLMTVPTVVAQRAHALGMEWSGFLGPLRPAKRPK